MKRRVINFVTLLSLLLCIAAAAELAWSWWAVYRVTGVVAVAGGVVHVHDAGSGSGLLPVVIGVTALLPAWHGIAWFRSHLAQRRRRRGFEIQSGADPTRSVPRRPGNTC
jgi:hypothetical protein